MSSTRRVAMVLAVVSGVALTAPLAAEAAGGRPAVVQPAGRPAGKSAAARKPGRVRQFVHNTIQKLRGARQHKYMPLRPGARRTVEAVSVAGGQTTRTTQVEQVTAIERKGGVLSAQLESTWSGSHGSTRTRHVVDVDRKGVQMSLREHLDSSPAPGTRTSGVGLPRRLRVGKSWTNRMSSVQDGYQTSWQTTSRVTGKVKRVGPDGRPRTGFVIESVTNSTTTTPEGEKLTSTVRNRAIYVKGVGEVESVSTTDGHDGTMTRRLIGLQPGSQ